MTDWMKQYTSALEARDVREQAHKQYIDAYTLLAERSRSSQLLVRSSQPPQSPSAAVEESTPTRRSKPSNKATASPSQAPAGNIDTDSNTAANDLSSLRADLATTQKARAGLASALRDAETQLSQLQAERAHDAAQIEVLSKAKTDTERKLRDRDEELRGKDRLVEQAQDEMVALGLQLHVAEDKAEKMTRENKDLVDRWMKRMEAEADKVNRDSRWS